MMRYLLCPFSERLKGKVLIWTLCVIISQEEKGEIEKEILCNSSKMVLA